MKWDKVFALICSILVVACAAAPVLAQNLLTNPGFEEPWGGDKYSIPGWHWWAARDGDLFDGVFDASWNVPPAQPGWPSNYGPHGGAQYLGRYYPPGADPRDSLLGGVYQTVEGLTPGATYYAQCWIATHHPHGGGAGLRIGIDPDGGTDPENANIQWTPPIVLNENHYEYSEAAYRKLETSAVVSGASATVFLQYATTSNDVSEPQIVQVDDVRLATTHSMEIDNVLVTGTGATSVSVAFDTFDAGGLFNTTGIVDIGTSPGNYTIHQQDATVRGNHTVTVSGLTAGQTYYYRCRGQAADYEEGQTPEGTFVMLPSLKIPTSSIKSSGINGSSAVIEWDTQQPDGTPLAATGRVEYGYTSTNYQFSTDEVGMSTHHAVTLTGLYPTVKYYYRVVSSAPGYTSVRQPAAFQPKYFTTGAGPFWNGSFDTVLAPNPSATSDIPGWVRALPTPGWFPSLEWGLPAQNGMRYVGGWSSTGINNAMLYQTFTVDWPSDDPVSMSAYVWGEGYGSVLEDRSCANNGPHRFGEVYCQIGIDPTGGADPNGASVVWSAQRSTMDWRAYAATTQTDPCAGHICDWQKIAVQAKRQGPIATVFLKAFMMWRLGWSFACWDNCGPEPVTSVGSIGEAKALGNDVPINLAGATPADSPVVTYVASPNDDITDNDGKPYFYVQDKDRAAGIKVTMANGSDLPSFVQPGRRVKIKGNLTWGRMKSRLGVPTDQQFRLDKPCGERAIRALEIGDEGMATTPVTPLGMGNAAVAGGSSTDVMWTNPGAAGGAGPNSVGLLVTTWGRVKAAVQDSDSQLYYLVIDDGSAVPGFTGDEKLPGNTGLFVTTGIDDLNWTTPGGIVGKYVLVTGISCVKVDFDFDDPVWVNEHRWPEAGLNVRCIKPLSIDDIVVVEE